MIRDVFGKANSRLPSGKDTGEARMGVGRTGPRGRTAESRWELGHLNPYFLRAGS